ncbi:MAG: type II toxin-antitoxin system MqsA family antitoxin [candidate division Zixibacteria bacterium]|nr:type II toxin-antitoxin system MqsA family antitoxin [Candidatus Tariuqbacter arcticus]
MKCVICKYGETQSDKVTITLERDSTTIVFKDVPAEVCSNCGESYLEENVSEQLLLIAEQAISSGVLIDIRKFKEMAI